MTLARALGLAAGLCLMCAAGGSAALALEGNTVSGAAYSGFLVPAGCGGYGGADCPTDVSKPKPESTEADPERKPQDQCAKGGYGAADCKSRDPSNGAPDSAADPTPPQGCGGYGEAACPSGAGGSFDKGGKTDSY